MNEWINKTISNGGVCRTGPATPGLLKTKQKWPSVLTSARCIFIPEQYWTLNLSRRHKYYYRDNILSILNEEYVLFNKSFGSIHYNIYVSFHYDWKIHECDLQSNFLHILKCLTKTSLAVMYYKNLLK